MWSSEIKVGWFLALKGKGTQMLQDCLLRFCWLAAIPPGPSLRNELRDLVHLQSAGGSEDATGLWKGDPPRQRPEGRRTGSQVAFWGPALLSASLWSAYHGVAQEEDGDLWVVLLDGVHMLQHISDKNLEVRYHHPLPLTLPMANWKETGRGSVSL